tara:strand:- start:38 stop:427 length:390 start_codon:yes stop_codon:yes gene_type:complete
VVLVFTNLKQAKERVNLAIQVHGVINQVAHHLPIARNVYPVPIQQLQVPPKKHRATNVHREQKVTSLVHLIVKPVQLAKKEKLPHRVQLSVQTAKLVNTKTNQVVEHVFHANPANIKINSDNRYAKSAK